MKTKEERIQKIIDMVEDTAYYCYVSYKDDKRKVISVDKNTMQFGCGDGMDNIAFKDLDLCPVNMDDDVYDQEHWKHSRRIP